MNSLASVAESSTQAAPKNGGHQLLQRQCQCGAKTSSVSGSCDTCSKKRLQKKLSIGASHDPLEQEADRVADQVLHTPGHSALATAPISIQRASASSASEEGNAPPSVEQVLAGSGKPLEPTLKQDMEQRFGHDFARVRVHSDAAADRSAREVGANAYTVGDELVFRTGQFAPSTLAGKRLLAHELTHVIQQSGASLGARVLQRDPYDALSIEKLRALAKTDRKAAEALWDRFSAMSNEKLARYADPMAQTIYSQRSVPAKEAAGQGRFSSPEMQNRLQQDIATERAALKQQGVTRQTSSAVDPNVQAEGGTIASARSDIPALENRAVIGRSPQAGGEVNPGSSFQPATDPKLLPQTHGHAEQGIADQLEALLKDIPREQLKGRKVWILVEQAPCSTCAQGTTKASPNAGVLQKLADRFPEVQFEIKSLDTSALLKPQPKLTAPGSNGTPAVPPGEAAGGIKAPAGQVPGLKLNPELPSGASAIAEAPRAGGIELAPLGEGGIKAPRTGVMDAALVGAGEIGGIVLGVVLELAIGAAIGLLLNWLMGLVEEAEIRSDVRKLDGPIRKRLQELAPQIIKLQQQGKVYCRITYDVRRSRGISPAPGSPLMGVTHEFYLGTFLAGVEVVGKDTGNSESKQEKESGSGDTIEDYFQTVTTLIDDPEKRAREKERAQLSDKLNEMAKNRPPPKPTKPTTAPADSIKPPQQNESPFLPAAPLQPSIFPGLPEGPLDVSARWIGNAEKIGDSIVRRGSRLEQQVQSNTSPSQQEINKFLQDETGWRTSVKYMANWSVDNWPSQATQGLKALLEDPAKPGPRLKELRQHLGGD